MVILIVGAKEHLGKYHILESPAFSHWLYPVLNKAGNQRKCEIQKGK